MASEHHGLVPVRVGPVEIASAINDARADQLVALDGQGNVISTRRLMVRSLPVAALCGGIIGGGLALSTALVGWVALPAVGVLVGGWLIYMRDAQGIRRSAELLARDDLAGATQQVASLRARWMPFASLRGYVGGQAAAIAWRRGDLGGALAHTEQAVRQLARRRHHRRGPIYWTQLLNRVQLLAALGRVDEAQIAYARAGTAPTGDWLQLERAFTELFLAFCRHDAAELPEDLHPWARAALQTNVFGGNLVLLAWAYDSRGDQDMAAHLLEEAGSRLERWYLDRTFPELWRWMSGARARLAVRS